MATHFDKALTEFRRRFPEQGVFILPRGGLIRSVVCDNRVPERAGAYVISAIAATAAVIYIGKAGTVRQDGTWKTQTLAGRLCNRQKKLSRQEFFQKMIAETGARELRFEWFVTINERTILPILAEGELLQAFYDDHQRLPRYNECV